jgi:hypothetical protein
MELTQEEYIELLRILLKHSGCPHRRETDDRMA